jgi:multiple sugar transport system substrate-binding protein
MNRKWVSALATSLVVMLSIAACSSGGSSSTSSAKAAVQEFTFVAAEYSSKTAAYWQDLVTQFEAANPGTKVNLQVINWNDITQKINTLVATNKAPDLLNIDTFSGFAGDGLLAPVSDYLPSETAAKFTPQLAANGTVKGVQYGVPLLASVRALFYNKTIFAKVHIKTPPATWSELRKDALLIKAAGYIGYGLPLGPEEAQAEFSLWLYGAGGDWKSGDKWTVNSPQALQALQEMKDLALTDKVTEVNPGTTNRDDLFKVFAQGKIGMIEGSTFFPTVIQQQNPNIQIGMGPVPTATTSIPSASLAVQDYMMAFKSAKNLKLVGQFLAFFYQPTNYVKFLTQEGFLPSTTDGQQAMASDPVLGPFSKLLPDSKLYPSTDPVWAAVQAQALQQLGTVVQGQNSPQSVLDALQKTAERGK